MRFIWAAASDSTQQMALVDVENLGRCDALFFEVVPRTNPTSPSSTAADSRQLLLLHAHHGRHKRLSVIHAVSIADSHKQEQKAIASRFDQWLPCLQGTYRAQKVVARHCHSTPVESPNSAPQYHPTISRLVSSTSTSCIFTF